MLSYWERQSFVHYDVVVIGSGIVGLSTALSLADRDPALNIAVLERGIFPAGASTRNAGFACIGSFTEILDDLSHCPEDRVLQLIGMRLKGLKMLRHRLGDNVIGYGEHGSYELISEKELPLLDRLDHVNRLLKAELQDNAFSLASKRIRDFGFDAGRVKALVENHFEGELHTGKMMQGLLQKAMQAGIAVKTGCAVRSLEEKKALVEIRVADPLGKDALLLQAGQVAVCTNAFTKDLLPDVELKPGRGQVLVTEPVTDLRFRGIFHFDQGYYYFRELDGRVLLGGGRNLDFAGETTTDVALNERIQRDLEEKLLTVILPGRDVRISWRWSGIMAFGGEKFPVVTSYSDRIFLGARLGGMGVAIGSEVGERLALMMLQNR
jgi:glycine/D-amino acid oxidase-like deaminating enzyme